ncbi:growth hormone-inducible transmembrane protein-like [Tropilaelaps mercedesae]|uniref:Growth hormone-inducible transmembrane protein-like n=1 Tax=Tropilaelaps mercedesae TaxID=418985 RepID=A0A1V9XH30_9ACAR|nr:growth hormone-inducible transmembrane protein-like [Tropilaelaps mercedesae]
MLSASRIAVSALCRNAARGPPSTVNFLRSSQTPNHSIRQFMQQQKTTRLERIMERRKTLKELAMEPATDSAFQAGKGLLAGASVVGLGALCYYGLGMSSEIGAVERAYAWPQYVRDRIRDTYGYFGGSIILTAASAVTVFRTPALLRLVSANSIMGFVATFAAMIGSSMLVRSIPYEHGFGTKQLAWMGHCGVVGAVIAPLCVLGGPIIIRAAWLTAGVLGGLSAVAACAPSDRFLNMTAPLGIGLGVVFASSVGSFFLPPSTALGAGLYSISLYGGLVLFSMFLLYDTQRIIKKAETHPPPNYRLAAPYDPINSSMSIYMDTINIFIRILTILAGGGSRKK